MAWHWKPAIVNPLLSYYIVFTSRPFWLLMVPSVSHWNMLYFQESQLFMYNTYCLLSWASNIGSCERSPDGCFGSTTNSVENKTQCQGALHRRGCGINCGCGGIVRNYISRIPFRKNTLACSAGVFFECAICSRKRHVETSRREEERGQVTYRTGYYFYSSQSSTVIKSKMSATTILRTRTRFRPPKIRLHCWLKISLLFSLWDRRLFLHPKSANTRVHLRQYPVSNSVMKNLYTITFRQIPLFDYNFCHKQIAHH